MVPNLNSTIMTYLYGFFSFSPIPLHGVSTKIIVCSSQHASFSQILFIRLWLQYGTQVSLVPYPTDKIRGIARILEKGGPKCKVIAREARKVWPEAIPTH